MQRHFNVKKKTKRLNHSITFLSSLDSNFLNWINVIQWQSSSGSDSTLPMQEARVQSLVRELRATCVAKKKLFTKYLQQTIYLIEFTIFQTKMKMRDVTSYNQCFTGGPG